MPVKKTAFVVGALAGASVAVAAMAGAGMKLPLVAGPHGGSLINASTAPVFAPPVGAPESFADIFERVSPAVVSIHVTSKMDVAALRRSIPGFENFPFEIVPKGSGGNGGDDDRPPPKQQSSGSGFFISSDGYIVTNNHVVDGADDIKVVTKDGTELKATVVGRDEGTDLAVLKVEGRNYPFVSFETAVKPRVGDWVVAVGNPFDLNGTATAGIISAYNRDIGENFVDYIQIDAPINRGNSGGPTFDIYGRVIGVNSAIYSPSGGSVGIGFAIPADVVVAVNGVPVKTNTEMTREVAKAQAGDAIRLDVFRAGKERQIEVRSGTRPAEDQLALNGGQGPDQDDSGGSGGVQPQSAPGPAILGMQLAPLNAATRGEFNIPDTVKGGVVVRSAKSACDTSGDNCLQRGDVIVQAGDREVASAGDVRAAVSEWKKAGRTSIPLGVRRGGQTTAFVPIKIEG